MRKLKEYDISFAGLKQGKHMFLYHIDKKFLDLFDYEDLNDVQQTVEILLEKHSNLLELHFKNQGTVNVNCDLTNEPFDMTISGEWFLVVKFGEEYNDENEELLVLPYGEHSLNVAQYIFEYIVLSVPAKRVHPQVESGNLHTDILDKLEELSPKEISESNQETYRNIDPRWNELKKLLTDKDK